MRLIFGTLYIKGDYGVHVCSISCACARVFLRFLWSPPSCRPRLGSRYPRGKSLSGSHHANPLMRTRMETLKLTVNTYATGLTCTICMCKCTCSWKTISRRSLCKPNQDQLYRHSQAYSTRLYLLVKNHFKGAIMHTHSRLL